MKGNKAKKDQFTAVLERVESKIDQIIERQQMSDEKFDRFEADVKSSFKSLADYLFRIEAEIMEMKDEIKNLRKSLKEKADVGRLEVLENRIKVIEKALIKQRILNRA